MHPARGLEIRKVARADFEFFARFQAPYDFFSIGRPLGFREIDPEFRFQGFIDRIRLNVEHAADDLALQNVGSIGSHALRAFDRMIDR